MVCKSSWLCAIAILLAVSVQSQAQSNAAHKSTTTKVPATSENGGLFVDEVIVESSLSVGPKQPSHRPIREALAFLMPKLRSKRQFNNYPYQPQVPQQNFQYPQQLQNGQSQATAQSNSHSHLNSPGCSQNADALANAQSFENHGQVNFGAGAANSATNTLNFGSACNPSGAFSNSGSQFYNLPNGQVVTIAQNGGVSFSGNSRPSTSQGSAISVAG